jgi:hypothetical protein
MTGRMRLAVVALASLAAVALPLGASAQSRGGGGGGGRTSSGGGSRTSSAGVSRTSSAGVHARTGVGQAASIQPSIGLSLPEIVAPLPPIGLPPLSSHPSVIARPPHVSQPIYHGGHRLPGHGNSYYPYGGLGYGYIMPAYGYGFGYPAADQDSVQPPEQLEYQPPPAAYGTLRVEALAAADAHVYVDGYYVGTGDQAAAGLDIEPGPHRIEVRAAGYETLTFDVRIAPNQVITYREAMKRSANGPAVPAPAPAPAPAATFYVISGCYVGNVPPDRAKLPDGCDASKVQTFKQ